MLLNRKHAMVLSDQRQTIWEIYVVTRAHAPRHKNSGSSHHSISSPSRLAIVSSHHSISSHHHHSCSSVVCMQQQLFVFLFLIETLHSNNHHGTRFSQMKGVWLSSAGRVVSSNARLTGVRSLQVSFSACAHSMWYTCARDPGRQARYPGPRNISHRDSQ